jgi:carbon monoxide dehydrogenase subunit G
VKGLSPTFSSAMTMDEREFPRMAISGGGESAVGDFDAEATLVVSEFPGSARALWHARADVDGRLASLGASALAPVVERIAKGYMENVAARLE